MSAEDFAPAESFKDVFAVQQITEADFADFVPIMNMTNVEKAVISDPALKGKVFTNNEGPLLSVKLVTGPVDFKTRGETEAARVYIDHFRFALMRRGVVTIPDNCSSVVVGVLITGSSPKRAIMQRARNIITCSDAPVTGPMRIVGALLHVRPLTIPGAVLQSALDVKFNKVVGDRMFVTEARRIFDTKVDIPISARGLMVRAYTTMTAFEVAVGLIMRTPPNVKATFAPRFTTHTGKAKRGVLTVVTEAGDAPEDAESLRDLQATNAIFLSAAEAAQYLYNAVADARQDMRSSFDDGYAAPMAAPSYVAPVIKSTILPRVADRSVRAAVGGAGGAASVGRA